ncbi:MAG TPA: hypothetical protein VJU61_15735 [Polyangiaceae bacterium]|nr:hypothetical protein [Polyangiaceae bacterium]
MNARYGHSSLARAIAALSLVASTLGSVGFASAATCDIPFPHKKKTCQEGSSKAVVTHGLFEDKGPAFFELSVDMQGGELGAVAYGIDTNGNHLSTCGKTAADELPDPGFTRGMTCQAIFNSGSGIANSTMRYSHPLDIVFTHVIVI